MLRDTEASRSRSDESRKPFQRLGPGSHREPWIPVFSEKTILIEAREENHEPEEKNIAEGLVSL